MFNATDCLGLAEALKEEGAPEKVLELLRHTSGLLLTMVQESDAMPNALQAPQTCKAASELRLFLERSGFKFPTGA